MVGLVRTTPSDERHVRLHPVTVRGINNSASQRPKFPSGEGWQASCA
jgi:hypothetical protein